MLLKPSPTTLISMKSFFLSNTIIGTVLAFVSPAAGSGKTSATVKFAEILTERGEKVLLIDADPKAGLSDYVAASEFQSKTKGLYDLITGRGSIWDVICNSRLQIPYVPAGIYLDKIEKDISQIELYKLTLADVINKMRETYSVILIDSPSHFGTLSSLVMMLSDYYLIPVKTKTESCDVITEVEKIHGLLSQKFCCGKLCGVFHSMNVMEDKFSRFTIRQIESAHYGKTLDSVIPFSAYSDKRHGSYEKLVDEISLKIPEFKNRER